jgi:hypothetical protein
MQSILASDSTQLHLILEFTEMVVTLLITLQALFMYRKSRRQHALIVLGWSMGCFTFISLVGFIGDIHLMGTFNTNWFKYIGQAVCLLFTFLGNVDNSSEYLNKIIKLQKAALAGFFLFMLAIPILPAFPNGTIQAVVSSSRGVVCLLLLYQYGSLFLRKPTSFTMLMSITFLLLVTGYIIIIPKFVLPHQDLLCNEGDLVRIFAFVILFIAYGRL